MLDFVAKLDRDLRQLDKILPQGSSQSGHGQLPPSECQVDLTIEDILTGYDYGQIPASPLQRAICRAAQGLELGALLTPAESRKYFGTETLPLAPPQLIELVCGVRGGKSWLATCAAIHAALTADLSSRQLIELPRYPIIAPKVDAADATFTILSGIVERSPVLSQLLDGDPTADTLVVRRPDGYRVELTVVAASRGGVTVRNRWLVGFILEEVAQFGVESTGAVINAEEILRAAQTRLLPGCQGWLISSPYGPQGLLYELWRKHFGKPGQVLVVNAPTRALNPSIPQSLIDLVAESDPDAAAREYGAEWVDADTAFLPSLLIDKLTRAAPVSRLAKPGSAVAAAMDAGTRGNAWTFIVAGKEKLQDGERVALLDAWESIGSSKKPLSPSVVLAEAAPRLLTHGVKKVFCDGWSFDANQDHAKVVGLELVECTNADADAGYARIKALLGSGDFEVAPVDNLVTDLKAIRQRGTAGSVKIVLPKQQNGRHCDFAPAAALAVNGLGNPKRIVVSDGSIAHAGQRPR